MIGAMRFEHIPEMVFAPLGVNYFADPSTKCWKVNRMAGRKRLKRAGATKTFSVSVSRDTQRRLKKAANRAFGGNVSALIEAIAIEADRQAALERLLRGAPPIDEAAYSEFLREMAGGRRRKRGRAA